MAGLKHKTNAFTAYDPIPFEAPSQTYGHLELADDLLAGWTRLGGGVTLS